MVSRRPTSLVVRQPSLSAFLILHSAFCILHSAFIILSEVPMISLPSIQVRRRPPRVRAVAALRLGSAVYSEGAWVRLTFDRPVGNVASMDTSVVFVDDGDIGDRFQGHGAATLFAPNTVQVNVTSVGPTTAIDNRLTAGAGSCLSALKDRGTWTGVGGLVLPFGP